MNILIIGNSKHLNNAIHKIYPKRKIKTISWRGKFKKDISMDYDLIFIVGFDFDSYTKNYKEYLNINIYNPVRAIKKYSNLTTDLVLISTKQESKKYTLSRYRFAKEMIANKLLESFNNLYVLRFDTFIDKNKSPILKGSNFTKAIFKYLAKIRVIETINLDQVAKQIKAYKNNSKYEPCLIKGIFLEIKRSQFIDRLLRLLIA
jgi:hypothetical protein